MVEGFETSFWLAYVVERLIRGYSLQASTNLGLAQVLLLTLGENCDLVPLTHYVGNNTLIHSKIVYPLQFFDFLYMPQIQEKKINIEENKSY